MDDQGIRESGLQQLTMTDPKSVGVGKWITWLRDYQFNNRYPDDKYSWLTCVLALRAVDSGNFGVGCVLVDPFGNVVVQGYNEAFNRCFHSDRHAEMVVMDEFEDAHRDSSELEGYVLYTSLESCPMCLARLIASRIGVVLHVADDVSGGMVHKMKDLPPIWIELAKRQVFDKAKCSPDLVNAASGIFLLNAEQLNEKLKNL